MTAIDDITSRRRRRCVRHLAGLALSAIIAMPSAADDRVTFVGVALDTETREADRRLRSYLERHAALSFAPEELEYSQVIERLVSWARKDGPFLARTTPYVQVVSEMLGADLEVLASYISTATGSTTYSAYYVARRDDLPPEPKLGDVVAMITEANRTPRFIHHSLFSTSSFFLPSLHLRKNLVFHMAESTESLAAIHVEQIPSGSSSQLVRSIARGEADLAAVWDGARARFTGVNADVADRALGRELAFVPLPSALPNDLLVCPTWTPREIKDRVRAAIRDMAADEIGVGDFAHWLDIVDAPEARTALAQLRWLAREQVVPVTVEVRAATDGRGATPEMLDAARHAVRLSGSEFLLYDRDFHAHIDYVWTIDRIHDGSARLRSALPGTGIEDQVFPISFSDTEDLTRRVVSLVQSRLHRIRYVWPYSGRRPMVIRDSTLSLPEGSELPVQRITWLDPKRNSFRAGPVFWVRVKSSSMFVHELEADDFLRAAESLVEPDPMSNVGYRVYQLRNLPPNTLHRVATGGLVVLLVCAAIAAVWASRRSRDSLPRPEAETMPS